MFQGLSGRFGSLPGESTLRSTAASFEEAAGSPAARRDCELMSKFPGELRGVRYPDLPRTPPSSFSIGFRAESPISDQDDVEETPCWERWFQSLSISSKSCAFWCRKWFPSSASKARWSSSTWGPGVPFMVILPIDLDPCSDSSGILPSDCLATGAGPPTPPAQGLLGGVENTLCQNFVLHALFRCTDPCPAHPRWRPAKALNRGLFWQPTGPSRL